MSLFHERFRRLKEESGKTQVQIANDLGIKQQAVSYYANGREPDYDTLIAIAKYFDVSLDYLLGVSDCKELKNEPISKKTGLSEQAIKVLNSEPPEIKTFWYKNEINEFVDKLLCSQRLFGIMISFDLLTSLEKIQRKAEELTMLDDDPESYKIMFKIEQDFVIAAAERQFSEEIIALARDIREENEKIK